ncbi:MAG: STAS domain-containing protein [Clostridiales bacterium]|nr:STAS domain-containing protein [Candidatus Coliplasma equi]
MNVIKTVGGSRMDIALEGKFDAVSAPAFESGIAHELTGISELYIDLGKVDYISSAGLRALLFIQQTLEESGGKMTVCSVPEIVMNIFEVTGFNDIINVI